MKLLSAMFATLVLTATSATAAPAPAESFFGVGMSLSQGADGNVVVENLIPNGPAERSQMVMKGDVIEQVKSLPEAEWVVVKGMSLDAVVGMIRGAEGTQVEFVLVRPDGAKVNVALTRAKIDIQD